MMQQQEIPEAMPLVQIPLLEAKEITKEESDRMRERSNG